MCNTVIPKRFKGFKGKEKHLHQHILNNNIKLTTHTVNITEIHTLDVQDYISTHTFIHICFFGTLLRQTPIPSHSQDINKVISSDLKIFIFEKERRNEKVSRKDSSYFTKYKKQK